MENLSRPLSPSMGGPALQRSSRLMSKLGQYAVHDEMIASSSSSSPSSSSSDEDEGARRKRRKKEKRKREKEKKKRKKHKKEKKKKHKKHKRDHHAAKSAPTPTSDGEGEDPASDMSDRHHQAWLTTRQVPRCVCTIRNSTMQLVLHGTPQHAAANHNRAGGSLTLHGMVLLFCCAVALPRSPGTKGAASMGARAETTLGRACPQARARFDCGTYGTAGWCVT